MTQVPVVSIDAVAPATVQTEVVAEAKLTAKPELAVAVRCTFAPIAWLRSVSKVMVCGARFTVKLTGPDVAAA